MGYINCGQGEVRGKWEGRAVKGLTEVKREGRGNEKKENFAQ